MTLNSEIKRNQKHREVLDCKYSDAWNKMDSFSMKKVYASTKFWIETLTEGIEHINIKKKLLNFEKIQYH